MNILINVTYYTFTNWFLSVGNLSKKCYYWWIFTITNKYRSSINQVFFFFYNVDRNANFVWIPKETKAKRMNKKILAQVDIITNSVKRVTIKKKMYAKLKTWKDNLSKIGQNKRKKRKGKDESC